MLRYLAIVILSANLTVQPEPQVCNVAKTRCFVVHEFVDNFCVHEWKTGPFWIIGSTDMPHYSPSMLYRIEHCTKCGIMRLPRELWPQIGQNVQESFPKPGDSGWQSGFEIKEESE